MLVKDILDRTRFLKEMHDGLCLIEQGFVQSSMVGKMV